MNSFIQASKNQMVVLEQNLSTLKLKSTSIQQEADLSTDRHIEQHTPSVIENSLYQHKINLGLVGHDCDLSNLT